MKPFLLGKKPVDTPPLRAVATVSSTSHHQHGAASKSASSPAAPAAPVSPHVDVIKEGDKVVRIVVTCGCGERIELACLYPAGS